ncbi:hypothetical protein CDL15_Pgr005274 [Punica granatum]|uniref:Uncharacterized protein n=1 Tax=Punica granatum TaxID=22663 RepID=A0A218XD62_PUNGR|nr:hypothetical protein CDL15_Pgr005274 [Punica granatum]
MAQILFLSKLELEISRELDEILTQEEILWFQKSRSNWIRFGDRNSKYFRTKTIIKRKRIRIETLQGLNGDWISDEAGPPIHGRGFFSGHRMVPLGIAAFLGRLTVFPDFPWRFAGRSLVWVLTSPRDPTDSRLSFIKLIGMLYFLLYSGS